MKELTIIIPFLNEEVEIEKTLCSIRNTTNVDIDIILINDASTDAFDYEMIAFRYNTKYVIHKKRQGVAYSRNEGVRLCKTRYFLLLDAHMRIYQNNWCELILSALKSNEEAICCCQTTDYYENDKLNNKRYGAYIDFIDLNVKWNRIDLYPKKNMVEIPCILGASYATNKDFWYRIGGLDDLKYYGFDEQLLSIKTWICGGKCLLIKNIIWIHLFRKKKDVPYPMSQLDFIYNKYYIIHLLFPRNLIRDYMNELFVKDRNVYNIIRNRIKNNLYYIKKTRENYLKMFKEDFEYIIEMNDIYKKNNLLI